MAEMARLVLLLSVLALVCLQLQPVHSQDDDLEFFEEPTHDVDGTSLSSTTDFDDEGAYTEPMPMESDFFTTDASGENADPSDGVYDGALMAEDSALPENITLSSANEDGFDFFETEDDSVRTADAGEELDASLASGSGCLSGNPIDDCWRCDKDWASNRQRLASCATGFGKNAQGGRSGPIYVVTSARDDDAANPAPGTLRYAVTRPGALWITFAYSMDIKLKNELMITSFKTIDGRGVRVRIIGGGGLTIQRVSNVIVHGIAIQDIKPTGPGRIMTSTSHTGKRGKCDGDAISIFASKEIWIDHCFLSNAADGLIDVIRGSTAVSITNNYFTIHDKVMLFGASKKDVMDRDMQVTVAYNTFGPELTQRMPRVRYGSVHVVNNYYIAGWGMYAIAGSEDPTILCQGNHFNAVKGSKQVTKRIDDGGPKFGGPKNWNWKSDGDQFLSGAYFTSVEMSWSEKSVAKSASCSPRPVSMVPTMCRGSGPLDCRKGSAC